MFLGFPYSSERDANFSFPHTHHFIRGETMRFRSAYALLLVFVCALLATAQVNQLTSKEKSNGWRSLFDGKTLNGWRGFHSEQVPAGWVVEDGCIKKIKAQGELGQAGGDLITR